MKRNKNIILAGLLALAATSCTDLDVNVESQYTEYPNNEIAVEAKMADLYYHLRGVYGRRFMEAHALSSDEYTALAFDGGYYDDGTYAHQALHTSTAQDASLDWYPSVAEGITKANKIIIELGGEESTSTAPARAMRALFHFHLMDGWGDIPILNYIPEDGEAVERKPRAEVAQFIADELEAVYPLLTEEVNANTYGKPTRWMAQALLAKLYINWAVYTASSVDQYDAATAKNEKLAACIAHCDDIINSGKFNLGSMKYHAKFSFDNGPHVEDFIYAMPYDAITQKGLQYQRPRTYKDIKNMDPSYYGSKLTQSAGGNMVMTPEFADLFCLEGDQRNLCVLGGPVFIYDPATLLPTNTPFISKEGVQLEFTKDITLKLEDFTLDVGADNFAKRQGYHSIKFFTRGDDYNNGRDQSNDLPIFRYADILLMKAEAIVRGGGSGDAKGLFNQIRRYVTAPELDHTPSLDEIYDERGREFLDENWRRNDMIRFGHYEDEFFPHYKKYDFANFDKTHRIWPLNNNVLDLNPTWKQNPGY